jgi:hypothetical protein
MTRTRPHARSRKRGAHPNTPLSLTERAPVLVRGADAVRGSRVMTAQARISAGYYERADVQDLVVTAVLNELRRR